MKKIVLIILLIVQLIGSNLSASAVDISSKVCNATTKVCISNITNPLTVKDDALLQACKDCCGGSQINTPDSIKGAFKGCVPRCKKSCEQAYKKEVKKKNPKM